MLRFILLFLIMVSTAYACDVIDDMGHVIHLNKPAKRIISLAPDITELLFAAGAGDAIIGVMQGSNFPVAAKKIPVIASLNTLNIEMILTLRPDLIVAWVGGTSIAQLQKLQQLGIPIFLSHQQDLIDIPKTLQKLGCLAGTEKTAAIVARDFLQRYSRLKKRYAHQKIQSVFYEMWPHPLLTVNHESWINQIITLCGGRNIFADAVGVAPAVNIEAVLTANPDVIISTLSSVSVRSMWQQWSQLTAVKRQYIFSVSPDWLERAGPRLLAGAEAVCFDMDLTRKQIKLKS